MHTTNTNPILLLTPLNNCQTNIDSTKITSNESIEPITDGTDKRPIRKLVTSPIQLLKVYLEALLFTALFKENNRFEFFMKTKGK